MTEALLTRARAYFSLHEGKIPWLYLDTHNPPLPTIGVGFMLPTAESAVDYPFINRTTKLPATAAEKQAEWRAIKKLPGGHLAAWYRPYTTLDLTDEAIGWLLDQKLEEFDKALAKQFDLNVPDEAHLGILDMAYSMGISRLLKEFPLFCAAFRRRDWPACAAESERKGVSKERNRTLAGLFRSAGETVVS